MRLTHKKTLKGYTIIEVVVVMLVIVILTVLATPKIQSAATLTVATQAEQLANNIRLTQTLSMTTGNDYYLIALSATSYEIRDASNTPIMLADGSTQVTLSNGAVLNPASGLLSFNQLGVPYIDFPPTTPLTAITLVTITGGGITSTITISPETGRVIVS
jgi:prepilin-type N-terminal cleavage/methylation domain-containing protein